MGVNQPISSFLKARNHKIKSLCSLLKIRQGEEAIQTISCFPETWRKWFKKFLCIFIRVCIQYPWLSLLFRSLNSMYVKYLYFHEIRKQPLTSFFFFPKVPVFLSIFVPNNITKILLIWNAIICTFTRSLTIVPTRWTSRYSASGG